jgi:rod shape determining protein RodA
MNPVAKIFRLNWFLFALMAGLMAGGLYFIRSATDYAGVPELARQQYYWLAVGFAVFLVMSLTHYETWLRLGPAVYAGAVLALVALLLLKDTRYALTINGATSWLRVGSWTVQPAEPAKLAFILGLSWLLLALADYTRTCWFFVLASLAVAVPAALIYRQPDLGTTLVLAPIALVMMWAGGVPKRFLALPLTVAALAAVFAYCVVYQAWWDGTTADLAPAVRRSVYVMTDRAALLPEREREKLSLRGAKFRRNELAAQWRETGRSPYLMKPYQLDRIKAFIEPNLDPLGGGWTINQSLNTIGSGGFKGLDSIDEYGFLPKNIAYNDFIFAVIGARSGFVGCVLFIVCQVALMIGVLHVGGRAKDPGGMLICLGVVALLFAHFFENVGMTIKVLPITGIPLPFTSYGGSFLVTCMAGMGLVQSVWIQRRKF